MSVFGKIMSAIFGKSGAARAAPSAGSPGTRPEGVAAGAAKPMTRAEVNEMIANIAGKQKEKYDWQKSIVDLMKLLKLDSSLAARKELAKELGYKGALTGSAEMNVWLHKQVMTKLAESGGRVPGSFSAGKAAATAQTLASIPADFATINRWYKQSVFDAADNKIGEIDDVLINREGRIVSFVVGVGGFLGMGEKHVAVPYNAVRATTKNNNAWYLVMNSTKETLQNATGLKYDRTAMNWT